MEWHELKAHLAECESCRAVFADMEEIHSHWIPERSDLEMNAGAKAGGALRNKILQRATREGARFSKAARAKPGVSGASAENGRAQIVSAFLRPRLSLAAAVIVSIAIALVAGRALRHRSSDPRLATAHRDSDGTRSAPTSNQTPAASVSQAPQGQSVDAKSQAYTSLERKEAQLEVALNEMRVEKDRLQRELSEAESKAGRSEQANADAVQRVADLQQRLAASAANEAKAEADLAKLRESEADNNALAFAQEQEIRALNAKLEQQSASIDRENQFLSAGREIRDLIAARNLHIIDVYDTAGDGTTKKAFGRAFYTEGKSLIFYAYDLPAHRVENAKYYAWGKRDGNEHTIRSLGLLYSDDQTQKRWVFKVTDPQVLSQIDSVFITLERSDNPSNHPRGKELLSAYLHSPPNHP